MRIYLDTMLWVYLFENHPEFAQPTRKLFTRIRNHGDMLVSSVFVLSELLVVPVREGDTFTTARYTRLFRSAAVEMLPYPIEAASIYAELRASLRVRPLDALHLAAAATAMVDLFLTRDKHLEDLMVAGIAE
jgi:predicted nucleic acid-binding protein